MGKPNKVTKEVKQAFQALLEDSLGTMKKDLQALKSKDRLNVLLRMAEYVVPKLNRIESISEQDVAIRSINYLNPEQMERIAKRILSGESKNNEK